MPAPSERAPDADVPEIRDLTGRQIETMWQGILPDHLLRQDPGEVLSHQAWEYSLVADEIEPYLPLAGARLLDLGCGLGSMLLEAARRGAEAIGIEPDAASLTLSQARLRHAGRPFAVTAAVGEALPFASGSCDAITCCSVLEHVQHPQAVLKEIARVLRPGGVLFLGVPNALNFQERHYKVFLPPRTPRFLARAWLRLRGRDVAFLDTLNEMTPNRALALVRGAGLEVIQDPVARRLRRLDDTLDGRAAPASSSGRLAVGLARLTRTGALLRALVRRGFFVQGAIIARRPA